MSVEKLIEISKYYGQNKDFVLGGGGNTSFKTDDELYIKCSGSTLGDMNENSIVKMCIKSLTEIINNDLPDDNIKREEFVSKAVRGAVCEGEYGKVPSIEAIVHAILPYKFVVHTHATKVNGITCAVDGEKTVKQLWGDMVTWIDAKIPGYLLAIAMKDVKNKVVFVQNHGFFVCGDSIEEIKELTDEIINKINVDADLSECEFDIDKAVETAPVIRMKLFDKTSIVTFRTNKAVMDFVENEQLFDIVKNPFTPDHTVYCKQALFVKSDENVANAIDGYKNEFGCNPCIIAVEKLGFFACGATKAVSDTIADFFMDQIKIAAIAKSFGGSQAMDKEIVDFINNWEAEKYRKSVMFSGDMNQRIKEKIVIVTGSAQGFGQGIAENLIEEGANVVIADFNYDLANKNSLEYNASIGANKTLAVKVDVSNEEMVKNMIDNCVLAYGGLDVFVNNAGIAKAGNLEEMDLMTFDLVTKINYHAYFLCAKYASRTMKIQNKINPDYYADIVQINSKSGLAGSNKNFAYAGSKFGGIGLTQSFALELVEFRIKVNSVCPGNFFEGPLWSNPENGLFVQYLKAGKVEGAKTVADVKKFYESKIPMSRGCLPKDVSRAILYCIEQEYETGQAIPVTGGQVMLK